MGNPPKHFLEGSLFFITNTENTMLRIFTLLAAVVLLAACQVEPRPIRYGQDMCHHCKMTLMDPKFGAELVTQKGKIYVFDDVNCLMAFLESEEVKQEQIKHYLVGDFTQPEALIDATTAFYLKSDAIKSPMASAIAAFPDEKSMKEFKKTHQGIYLAWGELITQFK